MEPLRSLLFIPGNRERFLQKARALRADALVPDLESGVPEPQKAIARQMVHDALPSLAATGQRIIVRVNALDSECILDDLNAVVSKHLTGVSVAKIESADDIRKLDEMLTNLELGKHLPFGQVKIIPWIESSLGVLRAFEIASASSRVAALAFGADDFAADMGVSRTEAGNEILYARHYVAVAARGAHRPAIDSPYVTLNDRAGLVDDIRLSLQLGFKGKFAIHPDQIVDINSVFSPSPEEIRQATRVVKAFERAEIDGFGTCTLDGKMIDCSVALRAQKLLRWAGELAEQERA